MQNWDAMQSNANYEQHHTWYNSLFAATIKTEPGTSTSPPNNCTTTPQLTTPLESPNESNSSLSSSSMQAARASITQATSELETYLNQQQQQHHLSTVMATMSAMTPSPSNNDSMQNFFDSTNNMQQQFLQQQQFQHQFQQAQQAAAQNLITSSNLPLGFNPLTPPGLPTAVLPAMTQFFNNTRLRHGQQTPSPQPSTGIQTHLITPIMNKRNEENIQTTLTPRNTPPMDATPQNSPQSDEAPVPLAEKEVDLISSSSVPETEETNKIHQPVYNSHGKIKSYKCKTCDKVVITKVAFWEHARTHLKPGKILQCQKCPFVTELKHHLDYHNLLHKKLKPYKCEECSYRCVNKSMLNSHLKSHSSIYQFPCKDCDYVTKYQHSLKVHLRKYKHKPGTVLDEFGVPDPSIVIDVYGTRRGPRKKSRGNKRNQAARKTQKSSSDSTMPTSQLSAALQGLHAPTQHQMPASPAKSTTSSMASDIPLLTLSTTQKKRIKNQQQQHQHQQQQQQEQGAISHLLSPLANILQPNQNMALFPFMNLNLQVFAAQQQAAVLAQLPPMLRETVLRQMQNQHIEKLTNAANDESMHEISEENDVVFRRKSVDLAMDLSQVTPTTRGGQETADIVMNLKMNNGTTNTPLISNINGSRRKGRALVLDPLLNVPATAQSPDLLNAIKANMTIMPSSPIAAAVMRMVNLSENATVDLTTDTAAFGNVLAKAAPHTAISNNTSFSSTASSSGISSSSSTVSSSSLGIIIPPGNLYECKYCEIFFRDSVIYSIHMGYHSCNNPYKCNFCGQQCDNAMEFFVHIASTAHP